MDPIQQIEHAFEVLARLGVEVREVHMGGCGGGLCTIRGSAVFFVDLDADLATRLQLCVEALASRDELNQTYLPPTLREAVERARAR